MSSQSVSAETSKHTFRQKSLNGLKLLVVDDSRTFCKMVSDILKDAEADVMVQTRAFGVAARVLTDKPDVVLLDVEMPGLSGLAALEVLRGHPKTSSLPVILLSALPELELSELARKHGANGYLCKGCREELESQLPKKVLRSMA